MARMIGDWDDDTFLKDFGLREINLKIKVNTYNKMITKWNETNEEAVHESAFNSFLRKCLSRHRSYSNVVISENMPEFIQYSKEMKNLEKASKNSQPIRLIIADGDAPVDWDISRAKLNDKYQSRDNMLFSQAISFFFEVEFGNINVDGWD